MVNLLGAEELLLLHPFYGLLSRTTWVSWYQKGKTSLDLNEARNVGLFGHSAVVFHVFMFFVFFVFY